MAPSGSAGIRKVKAAQTATALKEAARRLFLRQGYLNTKVSDITAEAGRATGLFYDHFASKEELLQVLLEDLGASADADPTISHDREHDLTDRAQLREHIDVFWRTMDSQLPVVAAAFQATIAAPPMHGATWQSLLMQSGILRDHMDYLQERGVRLPGDPQVVGVAMAAMLSMFTYAWQTAGQDKNSTGDAAIDTLTSLLLHGIAGQPSPE